LAIGVEIKEIRLMVKSDSVSQTDLGIFRVHRPRRTLHRKGRGLSAVLLERDAGGQIGVATIEYPADAGVRLQDPWFFEISQCREP